MSRTRAVALYRARRASVCSRRSEEWLALGKLQITRGARARRSRGSTQSLDLDSQISIPPKTAAENTDGESSTPHACTRDKPQHSYGHPYPLNGKVTGDCRPTPCTPRIHSRKIEKATLHALHQQSFTQTYSTTAAEGRDVRLEECRTRGYVSFVCSRYCHDRHFNLQADAGVAVVLAFRWHVRRVPADG